MGIMDFMQIPTIAKMVNIGERLAKVGETLLTDSGIKAKYKETGRVYAGFNIEGYRVIISVEDTSRTAIDVCPVVMEKEENKPEA